MKATMDLGIIPLGVGVSLSPYIAACEKVLRDAGLEVVLHAFGTNIEGDWDVAMAAVKRCHEMLHGMGVPRISTSLKIGTRTDREQSLDEKVASVQAKMGAREKPRP